jgi:hypothetical protein
VLVFGVWWKNTLDHVFKQLGLTINLLITLSSLHSFGYSMRCTTHRLLHGVLSHR